MIEWIVSSSVLTLIIAAIRFLFKGKISLRLQYALWGLVLVRLLLPFSLGSSEFSVTNMLPESVLQEEWDASAEIEVIQGKIAVAPGALRMEDSGMEKDSSRSQEIQNITALDDDSNTGTWEVQELKSEVNLSELWKIIWLLGSTLVGSILLMANVMFVVRLRKSRRRVECVAGKLKVYCTEAIETPCLFGMLLPVIYLTPAVMEKEVSLRHVLAHETTHYRHGDHIWAILRGVCLVIHWYNPLVWWAAALSRADAELACDEATIRRIGEQERAEYGRTLIRMTCQKRAGLLVTATTMTGSKRGIKERIMLLVKKPKMAGYTLFTVTVLALFAVGCTFTGNNKGEAAAIISEAPTAVPEITQAPITVTPSPAESANPTVAPMQEFMFDIQKELNATETSYNSILQKLQTDPELNQAEMNTLAGEGCTLWEETMDTFWNELEPLLTSEEVSALHMEQQEWLTMRDEEIQKIIETYDGGSITGLMVGQTKAKLTRERVYELAEDLAKRLNQMVEASNQDYSGHYVDTQGTDVVYSELRLELLEDGSYRTEIGIFRLTTLEGTAVLCGDMLMFEDAIIGVKGNIQFSENEAVFTVTESFFEYITPGEGFEFYKE